MGAARLVWLALALSLALGCGPAAQEDGASRVGKALKGARVLGLGDAGGAFAKADGPRAFQFPEDHGAHPAYRNEWWYLTCALRAPAGREFGVQFTLFRRALFAGGVAGDPWRNGQAYLAHFAVTDVQRGVHLEAERLARGHPRLAGAQVTEEGVRIALEDWRLVMEGEHWLLDALGEGMAATLRMQPTKPVVLQGEAGLSRKGPGQASYYYSLPRLAAAGVLVSGGQRHEASGLCWMDREWGSAILSPEQFGWAWFALMLDSGEDLMAFRLLRHDGARDPYDQGVRIGQAGDVRALSLPEFSLTPTDYWRDERGVRWPTGWTLRLADRLLRIEASVADQRMDTFYTYWEGLVRVQDGTGRDIGRGYMELTGYGAGGNP